MRGRRGGTSAAYGAEHTVTRREQAEESVRAGSRRLWPYLRRHHRAYLLGALLLVVTNLFMVSIPPLIGKMVGLLEGDPVDICADQATAIDPGQNWKKVMKSI